MITLKIRLKCRWFQTFLIWGDVRWLARDEEQSEDRCPVLDWKSVSLHTAEHLSRPRRKVERFQCSIQSIQLISAYAEFDVWKLAGNMHSVQRQMHFSRQETRDCSTPELNEHELNMTDLHGFRGVDRTSASLAQGLPSWQDCVPKLKFCVDSIQAFDERLRAQDRAGAEGSKWRFRHDSVRTIHTSCFDWIYNSWKNSKGYCHAWQAREGVFWRPFALAQVWR